MPLGKVLGNERLERHATSAPGPVHEDTPQRSRIRGISAGLFAQKGYAAVGIAEIGDAVGLARGALYHHIGSKEELLYNIVVRYIGDLVGVGRADHSPICRTLSRGSGCSAVT